MRYIVVLFLAVVVCSCSDERHQLFQGAATFESRHFTIVYRESDYSLYEVTLFCQRKERLLQRLNEILGVLYNGRITTYLYLSGTLSFALYPDVTEECAAYVRLDDGHEIAHLLVNQAFGHNQSTFLIEGFAVALQYSLFQTNIIEEFVTMIAPGKPKKTIFSMMTDNSSFELSMNDYYCAGAFLTYLWKMEGFETFKTFYCLTASSSDLGIRDDAGGVTTDSLASAATRMSTTIAINFRRVYGRSIQEVEAEFFKRYFPKPSIMSE
ncbi:MAG: hypothetical protein JW795_04445 [Chitinivibrionales bacterium]|nr:hypothetical protein [Chitinivibrionales bacterium]